MIFLDEIKENDLKLITNWRKRSPIIKFTKVRTELNDLEQSKWFDTISNNEKCKFWIIRSGSIKIGVVDINNIDLLKSSCVLEFCIEDENFRKRKITPEVFDIIHRYIFEELRLNNVYCNLFDNDERTKSIYSKYGYSFCGKIKCNNNDIRKTRKILCYKITKEEWNNKIC